MTQAFKLARIAGRNYYAPSTGEDLGAALAKAASVQEGDYRAKGAPEQHWGYAVAQMYYLAAEAYEQASSASIGHNRSARYEEAARGYRQRADAILAASEAQRDADRAKRLQAAFVAGYEDESAGEPQSSRYSFDAREGYLVGRYFARERMPIPTDVNSFRDKGGDWIMAGGCKYRVAYPTGKVTAATVTLEGPAA